MGILRFIFQATGVLTFFVALLILMSHSVPGMDFLHASGTQLDQPLSTGFLEHLGAAILLSGIGYLFFSWGRNG